MLKYMVTYGGTWYYDPYASCFPKHDGYIPISRFRDLGFRVVQDPEVRYLRGGAWDVDSTYLRADYCSYFAYWGVSNGFRVILR